MLDLDYYMNLTPHASIRLSLIIQDEIPYFPLKTSSTSTP